MSTTVFRDHAGGNEKMVKLMPGLKVYGGDDRVDAITKKVAHGNNLKVNTSRCNQNDWQYSIGIRDILLFLRLARLTSNVCSRRATQLATFATTSPKMTALSLQQLSQVRRHTVSPIKSCFICLSSNQFDEVPWKSQQQLSKCDITACFFLHVGDTLFVAGCGKFFEGTAEQMYKALIEILGRLPAETVPIKHCGLYIIIKDCFS